MVKKKILVVGATGLVGQAVIKEFSDQRDCEVIAISRRRPLNLYGAQHLCVDLMSREECSEVFTSITDITHVVYCALYEKPDLLSGWLDQDQINTNDHMLRNLLDPLEQASKKLKHITLLQGTKAYGAHVRPINVPAREGRSDARDVPNFYWQQEDYVKQQQIGKNWSWTIFRPQIIMGMSIGSPMNVIPAIGVYASLLKEEGKPLYYPGVGSAMTEAVSADLLARAISWAGETEVAWNDTFNITNGDVFVWKNVWPAIAATFRMDTGETVPTSLKDEMQKRKQEWDKIRSKYNLSSPGLDEFVGSSFEFLDRYLSGSKNVTLVSTVKLRQAGFCEVMDSEIMFEKWFKTFQDKNLLPRP